MEGWSPVEHPKAEIGSKAYVYGDLIISMNGRTIINDSNGATYHNSYMAPILLHTFKSFILTLGLESSNRLDSIHSWRVVVRRSSKT